jgi:hypothetical protein
VEMNIGMRLQPGITLSRRWKIASDATPAFRRLPPKATPGQKPSLPLGDAMTAVNLDPPFTGSGYLSFE